MKTRWMIGLLIAGLGSMVQATTVLFTGGGADQNFSTAGNWDTVPVVNDVIAIAANGTSSNTPAIIDSGFSTDLNTAKLFSEGAGDAGMAYAELASGATLKATSVDVGNAKNHFFDGTFTLRSGGTMVARYLNSGSIEIGGQVNETSYTTTPSGVTGFFTVELQ